MKKPGKRKILLVEDEAIIAYSQKRALTEYGYDVVTVMSGERAVEHIATDPEISLILMDINLGKGMDGTKAAEIILAVHDIPLLFLSSHTEKEIVDRTERITSYGYVVKDSGITVLDASMKMAFKLHGAKQAIKEREASLEKSNEQLKMAQEGSGVGIWDWNISHDTVEWSDEMFSLFGIERDEKRPSFETWRALVHPEDREPAEQKIADALNDHNFLANEYRILFPDGRVRWISALGQGFYDNAGKAIRMAGTCTDITRLKVAEKEMLRNQELLSIALTRYMAIFDKSPIAIEYYDAEGRLEMTNRACLEMFGIVDPSETEGFRLFDDPNVSDDIKSRLRKGEIVRQTYDFSFDLVKERGLYRTSRKGSCTIDCLITPLTIDNRPSGYIVQIQDITERCRIERSLVDSEEKYRLMAENIQDVFWVATPEIDRMVYVSPAYEKIWGRTRQSLYEAPLSFAEGIHPDDRQGVLERFTSYRSRQLPWVMTYRVIDANGNLKWVEDRGFPVFDDHGSIYAYTGTASDITERKKAEHQVGSLLAEKELLLEEVHHRLKNNMITIMSLLSLQTDAVKDPRAISVLEDTRNRIQSMAVLYEKLYRSMDFRTISAREYLPALIGEIAANFANHERVVLEWEIDDVLLDTRVLSPVGIIVNEIITNAMKYAFLGRDAGRLFVSFAKRGDNAMLVVEDDGNGMPADAKAGFGMKLIDMLTEQLDGSLRIERTRGTRFVLEFTYA